MRKWIRIGLQGGVDALIGNSWCKKFNKHKGKYSLVDRISTTRKYCRKVSDKAFRVRFIIKGEENIQKGQTMYVGNHTSVIDPLLFFSITDFPVTFLAKKEIEKMPIFKNVIPAVDGFFLDRQNLRAELKTFRKIDEFLTSNPECSMLVYPEGTRSKEYPFPMLEFHPGAFKIATRRDIPIVPVVMYLTDRILNQQFHYKVYPIQVAFLKPLLPEEYANMKPEEISETIKKAMEEEEDRMRERERSLILQFNGYSEKKTDKVIKYKPKRK